MSEDFETRTPELSKETRQAVSLLDANRRIATLDADLTQAVQMYTDAAGERDRAVAELAKVMAELDAAVAAFKDVGDFAHDRSNGPAVPDALWAIWRMAYDELAARKEGV